MKYCYYNGKVSSLHECGIVDKTFQYSRYFKLSATRTQPYLVTLFQAIMAFKKLAKFLRQKIDLSARKAGRKGM